MKQKSTLDSSCIKLINELGSLKTSICFQRDQLEQKHYTVRYNGMIKIDAYGRKLKKLHQCFCNELLNLPLDYPDCLSRKTFFLNLHKELTEAEIKINSIYANIICKRFGNELEKPISMNRLREPRDKSFNEEMFSSREAFQNCKVHYMFKLQSEYLSKAKTAMLKYAKSEKIDFEQTELEAKPNNKVSMKIKTDLNISQLSYAFNLFLGCISTNDYNKKGVAESISEHFETPRVKKPSAIQVYKKFFESEDSTKEPVKKLVIEMLNKINSN